MQGYNSHAQDLCFCCRSGPRSGALEVEYVKDALPSRLMQLHPVRNRLGVYEAPLPDCRCRAYYSSSDLTYKGHQFSPAQRAHLMAMSHEWPELLSLDLFRESSAADSPEAIFYREYVDWILAPLVSRDNISDADQKHLLLVLG